MDFCLQTLQYSLCCCVQKSIYVHTSNAIYEMTFRCLCGIFNKFPRIWQYHITDETNKATMVCMRNLRELLFTLHPLPLQPLQPLNLKNWKSSANNLNCVSLWDSVKEDWVNKQYWAVLRSDSKSANLKKNCRRSLKMNENLI